MKLRNRKTHELALVGFSRIMEDTIVFWYKHTNMKGRKSQGVLVSSF